MELLFIVDPLEDLKAYKDSSVAMMREAASRGHPVWACLPGDMAWTKAGVEAETLRLEMSEDDQDWYCVEERAPRRLAGFGAVLMRKDPPFDLEYLYSTHLLELAENEGARVVNSPRALRDFNEKLAIAKFPGFTAPSLVTRKEEALRAFLAEHGDIVLKPLDGMGGHSVFRVHRQDHNIGVILETLTHYGTRSIMAQRYLPEIAQGDKRVLVIDGEPVPFCLARIPKAGETRGNLAAGGTGVAQPLSKRDREIAGSLGPRLKAQGLMLVGLDVIGDCLTEVNVTSPTCMVEITQQTGFNVAGQMIDALERLVTGKG
ncbi:MAG TPA: glutathione synthase [Burkholderiales bacterium]|nr:glutathione synthase [Burkholderiales bacterium]